MRNNLFLFIAISFFLILSNSVYSQDSLFHYLELAGKTNPVVLQKYAEYQASLQKIPQAASLPDPELTTGIFLSPMELIAGKQVADIRLMQMFPWFGVLKNARDEMSLMAKAKYESFRDSRLQLFYEVQRTWYDLHRIKQNIRISEKNIELLHTIERLAIVRFKATPAAGNGYTAGNTISQSTDKGALTESSGMNKMGSNPGKPVISQDAGPMPTSPMGAASGGSGLSDVYRIQIEIAEIQNNIALLQNKWNTISAQFNGFLNRPQNTPVVLPDTLIAVNFHPALITLTDSSVNNNPMLEMLRFENQSLEARKVMVTKMGYPMVGIGLNYSLINKNEMSTSPMNGKDMVMPMLTVTLPIYRKKYRAMRNETEFLKSANSQSYKGAVNNLQTEYYQAIELYHDAERRVKLYHNQYQLASKSLDIMVKSFSSSGSSLTDILRIRQQMLDYEYKHFEAIADLNSSVAWIKKISCEDDNGNQQK